MDNGNIVKSKLDDPNLSEGRKRQLAALKPAVKGESRNPSGRPKQHEALARWSREKSLELGQDLFNLAKNASKDSDKIKAIELLLAYGIGRPKQQVDITTSRPILIAPGVLPDDALEVEPYESDA